MFVNSIKFCKFNKMEMNKKWICILNRSQNFKCGEERGGKKKDSAPFPSRKRKFQFCMFILKEDNNVGNGIYL